MLFSEGLLAFSLMKRDHKFTKMVINIKIYEATKKRFCLYQIYFAIMENIISRNRFFFAYVFICEIFIIEPSNCQLSARICESSPGRFAGLFIKINFLESCACDPHPGFHQAHYYDNCRYGPRLNTLSTRAAQEHLSKEETNIRISLNKKFVVNAFLRQNEAQSKLFMKMTIKLIKLLWPFPICKLMTQNLSLSLSLAFQNYRHSAASLITAIPTNPFHCLSQRPIK